MDTQNETTAALAAKITPPASVSIATIMGMPVSDLLIWATLIYTVLMIIHKLWQMYKDIKK